MARAPPPWILGAALSRSLANLNHGAFAGGCSRFYVMYRCLDHGWRERIVNFGVRKPSRRAVWVNSSSALPSRVPWHDKSRHPAATSNLETKHLAQSTRTVLLSLQASKSACCREGTGTDLDGSSDRHRSSLFLVLPSHKKLLLTSCALATSTLSHWRRNQPARRHPKLNCTPRLNRRSESLLCTCVEA